MSIFISLSSPELSDESVQDLTFDVCETLRTEIDCDVKLEDQSRTGTGAKGDPVTIGTIVLSLVGSGGVAVALIGVLKSYVDRGRHLKITVRGQNGETVEISADNLQPKQIEQTTKLVNKILSVT